MHEETGVGRAGFEKFDIPTDNTSVARTKHPGDIYIFCYPKRIERAHTQHKELDPRLKLFQPTSWPK